MTLLREGINNSSSNRVYKREKKKISNTLAQHTRKIRLTWITLEAKRSLILMQYTFYFFLFAIFFQTQAARSGIRRSKKELFFLLCVELTSPILPSSHLCWCHIMIVIYAIFCCYFFLVGIFFVYLVSSKMWIWNSNPHTYLVSLWGILGDFFFFLKFGKWIFVGQLMKENSDVLGVCFFFAISV